MENSVRHQAGVWGWGCTCIAAYYAIYRRRDIAETLTGRGELAPQTIGQSLFPPRGERDARPRAIHCPSRVPRAPASLYARAMYFHRDSTHRESAIVRIFKTETSIVARQNGPQCGSCVAGARVLRLTTRP